jgi:hypothetical protein
MQFTLKQLLIGFTVVAIYFAVLIATRSYYCAVDHDGYVYGFPLHFVELSKYPISVDAIDPMALIVDGVAIAMTTFVVLQFRKRNEPGETNGEIC